MTDTIPPSRDDEWQQAIAAERAIFDALNAWVEAVPDDVLAYCWRFGDGDGADIYGRLRARALAAGATPPESRGGGYKKKQLPLSVRTAVFERDQYRCRKCGTHKDLCLDHVHPESKGGSHDLDNLQTLCRPCNTSKGAKVE